MLKKITFAAAATTLIAVSSTAVASEELSYNFVQATYISVDFDDLDIDADGFGISGSFLLNEQIFLKGSYSRLETDRFTVVDPFSGDQFRGTLEQDSFTVGLGYRHELVRGSTDLNAGVSFVRASLDSTGDFSGFIDESDNGFALDLGIRHLLVPQFEVSGFVTYVDVFDDDETTFTLAGLFHITPVVSVGAGYSFGSDADAWQAGLRLNF